MSTPRFHPEARREVETTVAFLAERSPEAGRAFVLRLAETMRLIAAFPDSGSVVTSTIRAFPLHPFSHDLIYRADAEGQITILAVAHHRRRPGYWFDRAE